MGEALTQAIEDEFPTQWTDRLGEIIYGSGPVMSVAMNRIDYDTVKRRCWPDLEYVSQQDAVNAGLVAVYTSPNRKARGQTWPVHIQVSERIKPGRLELQIAGTDKHVVKLLRDFDPNPGVRRKK
jgi:hypothetical protein